MDKVITEALKTLNEAEIGYRADVKAGNYDVADADLMFIMTDAMMMLVEKREEADAAENVAKKVDMPDKLKAASKAASANADYYTATVAAWISFRAVLHDDKYDKLIAAGKTIMDASEIMARLHTKQASIADKSYEAYFTSEDYKSYESSHRTMVTAIAQNNKDIDIAFDGFQKATKTCASFMDVLK